jgi:hypothetical protein
VPRNTSSLRSGWDSAIKAKTVKAPNKSSTEEDDTSPALYGGMIGDNEDDEVERSVVVKDKKKNGVRVIMCVFL